MANTIYLHKKINKNRIYLVENIKISVRCVPVQKNVELFKDTEKWDYSATPAKSAGLHCCFSGIRRTFWTVLYCPALLFITTSAGQNNFYILSPYRSLADPFPAYLFISTELICILIPTT